jgi:hypothetical protein
MSSTPSSPSTSDYNPLPTTDFTINADRSHGNELPDFDNAHSFHLWLLTHFLSSNPQHLSRAGSKAVGQKYKQWTIPQFLDPEWRGLFATAIDIMAANEAAKGLDGGCCATHREMYEGQKSGKRDDGEGGCV